MKTTIIKVPTSRFESRITRREARALYSFLTDSDNSRDPEGVLQDKLISKLQAALEGFLGI